MSAKETSAEVNDIAAAAETDNDNEMKTVEPEPPTKPPDSEVETSIITLSSDSEGEEDEESSKKIKSKEQEGKDNDGLEIIQEIRPYSYMNRPRGPKTEFLKSLLEETNKELVMGMTLNRDTYKVKPLVLPIPKLILVQSSSSLANKASSTKIGASGSQQHNSNQDHDVISLSSDEEDTQNENDQTKNEEAGVEDQEVEKVTINTNENVQDSNTTDTNSTSMGINRNCQDSEAVVAVLKSQEESTKVLVNNVQVQEENKKPLSQDANTSTGTESAKTTSRKRTLQSKDSRKNSKTPKIERQINQLQEAINKSMSGVKELESKEVDLDDETNSNFLKLQRLKKDIRDSYALICKLENYSTKVGRPVEKKFKFQNNVSVTGYVDIERDVENYMNSKKINYLPDYPEIYRIVDEKAADSYDKSEIANKLFKEIVRIIRERRALDLQENGFSEHAKSALLQENDPALSSSELATQLELNAELAMTEQEVQDLYVAKQQELERNFGIAEDSIDEDDEESASDSRADESESDDEDEEDQEMGLIAGSGTAENEDQDAEQSAGSLKTKQQQQVDDKDKIS